MTMRETLLLNNRFHVILGEMMYSFARVSNISGSVEVETVNAVSYTHLTLPTN